MTVQVVKLERTESGVWRKYVEGREWGLPEGEEKERAAEEFEAEVRKCPKCETRCTYIDDEQFEKDSGWEREKWECTNCETIFKVDATSYRGAFGLELWEELVTKG